MPVITKYLLFHVCVLHPCSVVLDVYSVPCLFYLTTCVCVCHLFQTTFMRPRSIARVPFDSVRRFRASLLLHTTCVHLCCNWVVSCVAVYQTKNKSRFYYEPRVGGEVRIFGFHTKKQKTNKQFPLPLSLTLTSLSVGS